MFNFVDEGIQQELIYTLEKTLEKRNIIKELRSLGIRISEQELKKINGYENICKKGK